MARLHAPAEVAQVSAAAAARLAVTIQSASAGSSAREQRAERRGASVG